MQVLGCDECVLSVGAVLTKANLTKSLFPNPTQYRTARYPQILLTNEEMQEVKTVQPKGKHGQLAVQAEQLYRPHLLAGISVGCCSRAFSNPSTVLKVPARCHWSQQGGGIEAPQQGVSMSQQDVLKEAGVIMLLVDPSRYQWTLARHKLTLIKGLIYGRISWPASDTLFMRR